MGWFGHLSALCHRLSPAIAFFSPKRRRLRAPFRFEVLEDRTVPSTVTQNYQELIASLNEPTSWTGLNTAPPGEAQATVNALLSDPLQGDFNADGVSDVALFRKDTGEWMVGISRRDGFQWQRWEKNWAGANVWQTFRAGDFDGDGRTDIAALHESGEWWLARSTSQGFVSSRWSTEWATTSPWRVLQTGDFDGDGKTDVAGLSNDGSWRFGTSTGTAFETTSPSTRWSPGGRWVGFLTGDFNGDDATDIAALHTSGEWWVSPGGKAFSSERWLPEWVDTTNWATHVVGDFDGDGRDDIAAMHNTGAWYLARSTGASFETVTWALNWSRGIFWRTFQVGDFDHDGRAEVAAMHSSNEWWVIQGDASSSRTTRWAVPTLPSGNWTGFKTGDYNGDGNSDVLVQNANGAFFVGISTATRFVFGAPPGDLYFVSPWDLNNIRKSPHLFTELFTRYKDVVRKNLGPAFADLDDNGVALVLASIVAYEAASYRGFADPEGTFPKPNLFQIASLLNVPKLVCNEYAVLAYDLFRIYHPVNPSEGIRIQEVGWDDGAFGNHAQILVTGVGVPLLLDPTSGLVARADLATLTSGTHLGAELVRLPSVRIETTAYMEFYLSRFRSAVYDSLRNGRYPESTQLFLWDMDQAFP